MITRLLFVVEGLNNIRQYGNPTGVNRVRGPRLFETHEDHVQLCAFIGQSKFMPRSNRWLPTRGREGAYTGTGTSTRTLPNNRLNCRIQPLHVGMQTPGHFSAVVFRNRTWKPHFLSFVENLNGVVVISAVVVRNPLTALPWRVRSLVLEENQWKLLSCFELAT